MEEDLLKEVYDRFGPPIQKPVVNYEVVGIGTATYQYVVTAFNETGETDGDLIIVSDAPVSLSHAQYIKLSWSKIERAKGYRVYGRTSGGFGLLIELDVNETEFIDYGVLIPDTEKTPPTENKTGRENWERVLFLPGRGLQSAELNEVQSMMRARLKGIADVLFRDGDIVSGCALLIDKAEAKMRVTDGYVYVDGAVRFVKGAVLDIPEGVWYVGIDIVRSYVDENDDPVLRDPAQGYPGYATGGAIREVIDFVWKVVRNESEVDVVVWKVDDWVPTLVKGGRPQISGVESVIARKLYDLHGNVLVRGFDVKTLKHPDRRDMIVFEISAGKAYIDGFEVEKLGTMMEVDVAQDKSSTYLEEVPVWSGLIYVPDMVPVAEVEKVTIRVKVAETRYVPNVLDACNWYFDDTSSSIDRILGVWTDSSKTTPYSYSNTDPGCAERNTDVVLSGTGFALDPTVFSVGQSYYIEYLRFYEAEKGTRNRAYQEDTFVYEEGQNQYQLTKNDVIKSSRSPIIVERVEDGYVFKEGVDYRVELGRSTTTIGPARIVWLEEQQDGMEFKVKYWYWDHVVEGDYVAVDSYVADLSSYDYDEVEYPNAIDFRTNGTKPAEEETDILVQYKAYLSKWGWMVIRSDGSIEFVYGEPGKVPVRPPMPETGLPRCLVYFPAASQDVSLMMETRYQVKRDCDVNVMEDRLSRLEHDVGLTMAELELLSKETIAPKKALLVDTFVTAEVMDENRSTVSLDAVEGTCFLKKNFQIGIAEIGDSSNLVFGKRTITLSYSEEVLDEQLVWTEDFAVEVNPYAVFKPYVDITVIPEVMFWIEKVEQGKVNVQTAKTQFSGKVTVDDVVEAVKKLLKVDTSWQYGNVLYSAISSQIGADIQRVISVSVVPELSQKVVLVWLKNCLPYQDNIRAKFDRYDVSLSVATQGDINLAGLKGVTPRGSAGSVSGSVKANEKGEVIAKFTIPAGVPGGVRYVEVYSDDGKVWGNAPIYAHCILVELKRVEPVNPPPPDVDPPTLPPPEAPPPPWIATCNPEGCAPGKTKCVIQWQSIPGASVYRLEGAIPAGGWRILYEGPLTYWQTHEVWCDAPFTVRLSYKKYGMWSKITQIMLRTRPCPENPGVVSPDPPPDLMFEQRACSGVDPVAQSFYVDREVVVTSVWIWVHRVPPEGENWGIEVGIKRLTESGFPGREVLGKGYVTKQEVMNMMGISNPSQTIVTPTLGNAVKIQFDDPVYLSPGWYVLYIASQSNGYYVFTAKMKKKVLGSLADPNWEKIGKILDRQQHDGMFFQSYNMVTWEVDMERDLMFRLSKAVFNVNTRGVLDINVSGVSYPVHEFLLGTYSVIPVGAKLVGMCRVDTGVWNEFTLAELSEEREDMLYRPVSVSSEASSLQLRLEFFTRSRDVAPIMFRDYRVLQVWRYDSESEYYTKEVNVAQGFEYIKVWVNEQLNNGSVVYEASFDSGVTWYELPLVGGINIGRGWVEKELGGSLSGITGGQVSTAYKFIVRMKLESGTATKWMTPKLSKLRVLVY